MEDFDRINSVNYRGCWLSSRAEIKQMLKQEPLPTHDGRPGNRGAIVNIASQLGIVGRPGARKDYTVFATYMYSLRVGRSIRDVLTQRVITQRPIVPPRPR